MKRYVQGYCAWCPTTTILVARRHPASYWEGQPPRPTVSPPSPIVFDDGTWPLVEDDQPATHAAELGGQSMSDEAIVDGASAKPPQHLGHRHGHKKREGVRADPIIGQRHMGTYREVSVSLFALKRSSTFFWKAYITRTSTIIHSVP